MVGFPPKSSILMGFSPSILETPQFLETPVSAKFVDHSRKLGPGATIPSKLVGEPRGAGRGIKTLRCGALCCRRWQGFVSKIFSKCFSMCLVQNNFEGWEKKMWFDISVNQNLWPEEPPSAKGRCVLLGPCHPFVTLDLLIETRSEKRCIEKNP